ncbi:MAG: NrtA/SsuA/CpmA family ABC transporter substrate-binding protein [Pseudomonadota bacterium]
MLITRRTLLAAAGSLGVPPALCACHEASPILNGRRKVRLTYGITSVAKVRGVLEATLRGRGIDVEWIGPFPNHAPTLQAVATGSADFSFGGSSTPAAQAIASGAKLSFVSWTISTPRTTSIIVLPKSGITTVAGLAGKTVAVNRAGVAEFLLVAALEKYRVPRDQVNVVYMNPPDAASAFAAGKVDAWAIWSGPLEMAEVQYGAQRIFEEGKELDQAVDFGTYLVRDDYARHEPDTIRAVIQAQQAELEWANLHRAEAQAIGYRVSKYPPAVIEKLNQQVITSKLSFMNDEGEANLQRGVDWLSERKVLSGKLNIAEHSVRL